MKNINVDFLHGLGDCVYFAHQLAVYKNRGYDIGVHCRPDKQILFRPVGCTFTPSSGARVAWRHGESLELLDDTNHWLANKAFANFSVAPMPDLGPPSQTLWNEFSTSRLDIIPHLPEQASNEVSIYLSSLPRPIVLLHTKGNSFQRAKSAPDALAIEIYRAILDSVGGTLLLLDWDDRVPRIANGRIKRTPTDPGPSAGREPKG